MINADRAFFLRDHIAGQLKTAGAMEPEAFAEYLRCYDNPATVHAICEDYRAAAGIDLADDAEDADKRIRAPLMALWGAKDSLGICSMYSVPGERRRLTRKAARSIVAIVLKRKLPKRFSSTYNAFLANAIARRIDLRGRTHAGPKHAYLRGWGQGCL
jgi:hypothetical protein